MHIWTCCLPLWWLVSGANFLSGSQRIYISSAAWQALSRTLIRRWFLVQTSGAHRIYLVPIKCLVQQLSPGLSSSGGLHALLLLHSLPCTTPTLLHALSLSLSYIHYICIAAPFTHSFPTKPSPLLCVANILHVLALTPFFVLLSSLVWSLLVLDVQKLY